MSYLNARLHSKSLLGQKNMEIFHVEVAGFAIVFIVDKIFVQDG
jgi:hypothetical protein